MEKTINALKCQTEYLQTFIEILEGKCCSERYVGKTIKEALHYYHDQGVLIQNLINTIFRNHGDEILKNINV